MSDLSVHIRLTQPEMRCDAQLPVQLAVCNDGVAAFVGGSAELTLEVEKGVLMTWLLDLRDVPAETCEPAAIRAPDTELRLPAQSTVGLGTLRVRVFDALGAQLAEDEVPLTVTSTTSPS